MSETTTPDPTASAREWAATNSFLCQHVLDDLRAGKHRGEVSERFQIRDAYTAALRTLESVPALLARLAEAKRLLREALREARSQAPTTGAALIWRKTAPDVEEADGPGGARFRVRSFVHQDDARKGRHELTALAYLAIPGGYGWEQSDYWTPEQAKAECQRLATWAASCGAAQDRAGRGEVGL